MVDIRGRARRCGTREEGLIRSGIVQSESSATVEHSEEVATRVAKK